MNIGNTTKSDMFVYVLAILCILNLLATTFSYILGGNNRTLQSQVNAHSVQLDSLQTDADYLCNLSKSQVESNVYTQFKLVELEKEIDAQAARLKLYKEAISNLKKD